MPVTSMQQILGRAQDYAAIKNQLKQAMAETFKLELEEITWENLKAGHELE
jgi:hypothetical protein